MSVAHAMPFIDKIKMRINLNQMEWFLIGKRVDTGNIYRMIAAKNNRNSTSFQNGANTSFDIGMALHGIGMDNIRVANIDNPHLVSFEIGDIILMVISPRMTKGKKCRCLTNTPRAKAGTCPELRT